MTRAERLAGEIADAILAGEFGPGSRLDEQGLASRYDVSRTPVREALRQLGASGLIEIRPHRGATVAHVTRAQLEEMFVAMGEIEATCARLAAMRMTPVERRRLVALHEGMTPLVRAQNRSAYAELNVAFHTAIYAGAHNAIIAETATGLRRRLLPYRRAQFRAQGRLPRSHAEHGRVVKAIVAGDADASHRHMLDHVSLVEDAYEKLIAAAAKRSPRNALIARGRDSV